MKKSLIAAMVVLAALVVVKGAEAHVVVKPNQAGVGTFQTFTIDVPSEKELSTIELRLLLPEGLNYVTPTVKQGYSIRVKKEDSKNLERVTEIAWFATGVGVPKGQRDEFSFSAQVPTAEATLQWKAHQIYSDGSVVSWEKSSEDQPKDSAGKSDYSQFGPFSETKVVNDLKTTGTAATSKISWEGVIAIVALALSVLSFTKRTKEVVHHHKPTV